MQIQFDPENLSLGSAALILGFVLGRLAENAVENAVPLEKFCQGATDLAQTLWRQASAQKDA